MGKRVTIKFENGDTIRKTIPEGYSHITEGVLKNGDLLLEFAGYGSEWSHQYKWILVDSNIIEHFGGLVSDQKYVLRKDNSITVKTTQKTHIKSVPTKYDHLLELEKEVKEIIKERENSQKSNDNVIFEKMNVIAGKLDKIIQFLESIKYNTAKR